MGKKKKNAPVSLGEFFSSIAEPEQNQPDVYRPPALTETPSTGGGSFRGRDNEKTGNRKTTERKPDANLDFMAARKAPMIKQPQPQQPEKKPSDHFSKSSFNQGPPGKETSMDKKFSDNVPPSTSDTNPIKGRFARLAEEKIDRKPEYKKETKVQKSPLEDFTRGSDLIARVLSLQPRPPVLEITNRILELTPFEEIDKFNWITAYGFKPLFQELMNHDPEARLSFIVGAQKFSLGKGLPDIKKGLSLFSSILFSFYKEDLIYESDVERWLGESQLSVRYSKYKSQESCADFVFWLRNVEVEES